MKMEEYLLLMKFVFVGKESLSVKDSGHCETTRGLSASVVTVRPRRSRPTPLHSVRRTDWV